MYLKYLKSSFCFPGGFINVKEISSWTDVVKDLIDVKTNVDHIEINKISTQEQITGNNDNNNILQTPLENNTVIKKRKITIDDLVKCPHEDHTYALSAASLGYYTEIEHRHAEDENDEMKNDKLPFLRGKFKYLELIFPKSLEF